jgi:hypothetical protein
LAETTEVQASQQQQQQQQKQQQQQHTPFMIYSPLQAELREKGSS